MLTREGITYLLFPIGLASLLKHCSGTLADEQTAPQLRFRTLAVSLLVAVDERTQGLSVAHILPLVFLVTLLFLKPITCFYMDLLLSTVATSGKYPPGLLALLPAVPLISRRYSPYSLYSAPSQTMTLQGQEYLHCILLLGPLAVCWHCLRLGFLTPGSEPV